MKSIDCTNLKHSRCGGIACNCSCHYDINGWLDPQKSRRTVSDNYYGVEAVERHRHHGHEAYRRAFTTDEDE